jgi:hypothetical protein
MTPPTHPFAHPSIPGGHEAVVPFDDVILHVCHSYRVPPQDRQNGDNIIPVFYPHEGGT